MTFELPEPDPRPLARSPLQLAVCQIRHESLPSATEARVALAVHQVLGGRQGPFKKMEPLQNLSINLGAQPLSSTTPTGWRLTSESGDWLASLQSDHFSLETTAYDSWDGTFRDRLFSLVDAVSDELEPETVQRIGLRYQNRIADPPVDDPQAWERYLAPEMLGLVRHPHLGSGVKAAQQQVDLEATDELSITLRHGFFRDAQNANALTYIIDIDTYRDGYSAWSADEIKAVADELNDLSLRVFQQVLSEEMLEYMRGADVSGS